MLIAPAPERSVINAIQIEPLGNDVHIWVLAQADELSADSALQQDSWWDLLASDEVERARRFHFSQHAAAFVANRARLRILLAQYLQTEPASLEFTYSDTGKPELSARHGSLFFNLSHTEGAALVAVSRCGRVGVDIERMTPSQDSLDLARSYFSRAELQELSALPPSQQQSAFYRCWTRKEAFLKGLGDGLSRPLSEFSVSSGPLAELLECKWDPGAPARWQLLSLDFDTRYAAALAYEGNPLRLSHAPKFFYWSSSL